MFRLPAVWFFHKKDRDRERERERERDREGDRVVRSLRRENFYWLLNFRRVCFSLASLRDTRLLHFSRNSSSIEFRAFPLLHFVVSTTSFLPPFNILPAPLSSIRLSTFRSRTVFEDEDALFLSFNPSFDETLLQLLVLKFDTLCEMVSSIGENESLSTRVRAIY